MTRRVELPVRLTTRAVKVLQLAPEEARRVGASGYIGVEHIFLAILREGESVPAQVVKTLGLDELLRSELEAVLSSPEYRGTSR